MGSRRWRRNRRLKCLCGGYHFPHRRGGGACEHSATALFHTLLRQGVDRQTAHLEQAVEHMLRSSLKPATHCPF